MQRTAKLMSCEAVIRLISQLSTTALLELSCNKLISAHTNETATAKIGTPDLVQYWKTLGAYPSRDKPYNDLEEQYVYALPAENAAVTNAALTTSGNTLIPSLFIAMT